MSARNIVAHNLRHNWGCALPSRIIVLDTETESTKTKTGELLRMRIGWTVYADIDKQGAPSYASWNQWASRYEMAKYIAGHAVIPGDLWIVGNNIFFDLQASDFFVYFARWGWTLDFYHESGLTYMLICSRGPSTLKVVSLTNYYAASVKDLGEMIGKPKIECDPLSATLEDLSIYCRRDTEITYEAFLAWVHFVKVEDLGNFSLSLASQAMAAFRHRFMDVKILVHTEKDIKELEGNAYFGGRTEAFFIGKPEGGPFVHLDVNSLYPYIMRWRLMPTALVDVIDSPSLDDCAWISKKWHVIADADVETDVPIYAAREDDKILFQIGHFRTYLCSGGMCEAIERGHLRKVRKMAVYSTGVAFETYVDHFYKMRQDAKAAGDLIKEKNAKLMLNSLYGKFGEKRPASTEKSPCDIELYSREEIYDMIDGVMTTMTCMLGTRCEEIGREYSTRSVVAIPAHITEYGRLLLWSIIEGLGREKVIYCDTDSIIIRERDLAGLQYPLDASRLGALKIEDRYSSLEVTGAKDYKTDHSRKLKGIPKDAVEIGPGIYRFKLWARQATHLERKTRSGYILEEMTRVISGEYDKGIVHPDGHVEPFTVSMTSPAPSRRPAL